MLRFRFCRALTVALVSGSCLGSLAALLPVSAQSAGPATPPAGINAGVPTVSGTLVAKPFGRARSTPTACRDSGPEAANAVPLNRGIVICTEEGRLVLLQLQPDTGIYARYWGRYGLRRLTVGDHINAWGTLAEGGSLLNPTAALQDTDIQMAFTQSQDFVTRGGHRLTLDVLQSASRGPVQGIVYAVPGGKPHITLCNGQPGSWADLHVGMTIDISRSLFNRRIDTYIDTGMVHVANCG